MNSIAFELGSVLLVKSMETGLAVFLSVVKAVSICQYHYNTRLLRHLSNDFLTILKGGRLLET